MRTFSYRARAADGTSVRGTIAAASEPDAVRVLAAEGKAVLHLKERRSVSLPAVLGGRGGITAEERIAFLHELAALLAAGLPVHEALARLVDEAGAGAYGRMVSSLHAEVLRGLSLSQGMEMQADSFPKTLIGMVRAGEESGRLAEILQEAASVFTEAQMLRESLRGALAYPLFLCIATLLSMLLMTVFVLPIFSALLRDLGTDLPLPTQMLLTLSDFIAGQPYLISAAVTGGCIALFLLFRLPSLRLFADGVLLRIPVLGMFVRLTAWQMILRTLAILLRSGIRLDCAMGLARMVTENRALAHHLARMEQRLVEGRTFAQVIADAPSLPPLIRGMLSAGEAAGDLERLLQHAADYCRRRAGAYAARIEALAEPVMIVIIAGMIFFVVLSVLLPIFDTMDALM